MDWLTIFIFVGAGSVIGLLPGLFVGHAIGKKSGILEAVGKNNSPLFKYSIKTKEYPFILYIHRNGTMKIIPITEKDLEFRYFRIGDKLYKLTLENSFKLTYYDENNRKVYTQDVIILLEPNVHPQTIESLFNHFLAGYFVEHISYVDRILTAIDYLSRKLEKTTNPKEIRIIQAEIQRLKEEANKIMAENEKGIKALDNPNIVMGSSILTPRQVADLENIEVDEETLNKIIKELYPQEEEVE